MTKHILKHIAILSTIALTSTILLPSAYAQITQTSPENHNNKIETFHISSKSAFETSHIASRSGEEPGNTTDIRARADQAISNRIKSLNNLLNKITTAPRLSDTTKATLISQVQDYITNLTNLKAKIDGDTDPAVLKTDIKSIVDEYRVYAFFMPQMAILSTANAILTTTDKISSLSSQLQTLIQTAKSQGKDTTSMQTAYNDMLAKVSDAKTQAQNAIASINGLSPTGFPGNTTALQTARADILKARQDIETAIQDIHSITGNRSEIKNPKNQSASNSATNQ